MIRETLHALAACVVTFVLCAVAYPAAAWGLGWLLFPRQAEGSLVHGRDRSVIGSELIAQPFASDVYFRPRPSAADFNAAAASGSNLGTKNPDLRAKIKERAEALKATPEDPVPADLVTASGCGLDPHISPEAARYQAVRVAAARKMPVRQVRALIDRLTEHSGAILGAPARVNVLRLNLTLDEEKPEAFTAADAADGRPAGAPGPAPTDLASDVAALRSRIGDVSERVKQLQERLRKQAEAVDQDQAGRDRTRAELKGLEDRVARRAEDARQVAPLVGAVSGLEARVKAAADVLQSLRVEVEEAREALKSREAQPGSGPALAPTARRPRG
jgi:potassium-transporting ATPase KdpC subunit